MNSIIADNSANTELKLIFKKELNLIKIMFFC